MKRGLQHQREHEPIAVIGSGCRFPGGCTTPSRLWDLLENPTDIVSEITPDRFNVDRFFHPDHKHHGTSNVRHSYMLQENFKLFDAKFFGVKPQEAIAMDPQQRLLLETVYESLEAAGIPIEDIKGSKTGVFVGNMGGDYSELLGQDLDAFPTYFAPGTARSILSNRISYFFDLHGPSVTIDTACSSSLVAVHQAVQSLRLGETPVAIACGTNLLLGPSQYIAESKLQMLSPNGRSRMWDASADGYARGEGFASVVLKTLSAALADGDHIECIIRETGVNQDGRTKGITMPSPLAQANLIRDTYKRAGLDLNKPSDRPQYFEAHGTGTPAGDPVEAEAISSAFFGPESGFQRKSDADPKLYVGSIKTVIGHTEGTAGLAALIKASLAMKARRIPPNLHLDRLNPAVEPFYKDLEVPTKLMDWPQPEPGQPLRASVNSFGFGGANAHAIIESYETASEADSSSSFSSSQASKSVGAVFSPFTFSAASETALSEMMSGYNEYLKAHPDVDCRSLAFTLNQRRSTLEKRAVISATNLGSLQTKLEARIKQDSPSGGSMSGVKTLDRRPRILGVFTGQGAQWPRMGADMVVASPAARAIIEELEESLKTLPKEDRPSWSLVDELLAPRETSRMHQAIISQTLCTAVQVMLVQLLRSAGVVFSAVVGHSSGEIAAAYTAGYLSARDAIRVAYYRGVHTTWAKGPRDQQGGMVAVGTSFEDAKELCALDTFEGRLSVAASNSRESVTLSGDIDAIQDVKKILDAEGRFNRQLQVDKAYHSHHMIPCLPPYVSSLQKCNVEVQTERSEQTACQWISSVYVGDMEEIGEAARVQDKYWGDNMAKPVLFSQALSYALGGEQQFDYVIEVGPHPALKGPASATIQNVIGEKLPYGGCLRRDANSIESFAECLGDMWAALGHKAVDFPAFEAFASGSHDDGQASASGPRLIKGLPSYPWEHNREYYFQSRLSKAMLTSNTPTNELLGARLVDNSPTEVRWRNSLHSAELPWLLKHHAQGQTVFPGAGYISTALEAVKQLFDAKEGSVQTVEVRGLVIKNALMIEENVGIETIFSLTAIDRKPGRVTAHFVFSSQQGKDSVKLIENASGDLHVFLGEPSENALPGRLEKDNQMKDLEEERFYEALDKVGYGYAGPFKALSRLKRRMGAATGVVRIPEPTPSFDMMLVHPAALDATVQSILLAYAFPGDTRLQSIYLPTGIDCVRFNFGMLGRMAAGTQLPFRSSVPLGPENDLDSGNGAGVGGDVDVFSEDGRFALIQLQGLRTKPLSPPSATTDLHIFSEVTWKTIMPVGANLELHGERRALEASMFNAMERVAYFYMRNIDREVAAGAGREVLEEHQIRFLEYVDHVRDRIAKGTLPHIHAEWDKDARNDILAIVAQYPDSIDLQLMHSVGENLPAVFRGEMNALEPMVRDNMLNRFYADAMGMAQYTEDLARMAGHMAHRYPHMRVLEVGAGTGGATKVMLRRLDNAFASYTYTDISSGFFSTARETFRAQESKMAFRVLDIEKDIVDQGYEEASFDVVIANLVVHATRSLDDTMAQLRRLVRPGGYLLLLEITDNDPLRFGFIFGPLPGWWLGVTDGRKYSPCIDQQGWDEVMRRNGFSGADVVTPHHSLGPLSVILTQAVDDRVQLLRNPIDISFSRGSASFGVAIDPEQLTIVGGASPMAKALENLFTPHYKSVSWIPSIEEVPSRGLPVMGSVLSLVELNEPLFEDMTTQKLEGFKHIIQQSKSVYWITKGASGANPYSNMAAGVGRTMVLEMDHVRLGYLDFDQAEDATAPRLAGKMLEFDILGTLEQQNKLDGLTWYREPELRFSNGSFLVPRIRLSKARNARYNSQRRALTNEVDHHKIPVSVVPKGEGFVLHECPSDGDVGANTAIANRCAETRLDTVSVAVDYAVLRSVKLPSSDYLFLVLGKDVSSGKAVFALTDSQRSVVKVDRQWTIPCAGPISQSKQTLVALHAQLMALTAVAAVAPGQSLVVLDADKSLASALSARCAAKCVRLALFSTESGLERKHNGSGSASNIFHVHRLESRQYFKAKLPSNIGCFLNLSGSQQDVARLIVDCIPSHCRVENLASLTDVVAHVTSSTFLCLECTVPDILRTCWAYTQAERHVFDTSTATVATPAMLMDPSADSETRQTGSGLVLIDWTAEPKVNARIRPADSIVRFKQDKTYWLVGLTGGLALSLCAWMVDRGARYVVMTSRNPKVDQTWLQSMESQGVTVRIFSNDVTDREALNSAYRIILATMPPIAGVVQGAMVLHDTMFADTTVETVNAILGPKVKGSIYLDDIFHSTPLDFFVFLSSVASTTGNPGQSIYGGSNMFMNALAAQRRRRGVPGSSVEIGAIMGNGSVTSKLSFAQQKYLFSVGNMWMSEQDFLTMFAEAVLASHPDSPQSVTTTAGLRLQYSDEDPDITWFTNPIFQHLVLETGNTMPTATDASKQGVPVKTRLQDAKTSEEVFTIVSDAFHAKLVSSLQADADRDVLAIPLETLGMDSLVAVDLRSWFLRELTVDVPVLKILNSGTAKALIEFVQGIIPESMTPKLRQSDGPSAKGRASERLTAPTPPPATTPKKSVAQSIKKAITDHTGRKPAMADSADSSVDSPSESLTSWDHAGSDFTDLEPSSPCSSQDLGKVRARSKCLVRTVPLSFGQSRFWFLRSYVEDPLAFNITSAMRINGPLRPDDLAKAVDKVAHHHEALRTSFVEEDNVTVQKVWSSPSFELEMRTIPANGDAEAEVKAAYEEVKNTVFKLEEGQTMRIQLLSKSSTEHVLVLGYHHINMDGVSFEVFFADLEKAYNGQPLNASVTQYPDFSVKEAQEYKSGQWEPELAYWRTQFDHVPEPIPLLPVSKKTSRPAGGPSYRTHTVKRRVDAERSRAIQDVCRRFRATPFHFHLAVYRTLIARLSGSDDFCIGIADANRKDNGLADAVGLYLNLLPLRVKGGGQDALAQKTFGDALAEMRKTSQEAFANSRVPLDILLSELAVPRSSSHAPLFQIFLNYRRGVSETRPFCGCTGSGELIAGGQVAYDVNIDIVDNPEGDSLVVLTAQQDLYDLEAANLLLDCYFRLLAAFSRNPASSLSRPALYDTAAVEKALTLGRGPLYEFTWPETLMHRINDMADKYASKAALRDGHGDGLTYAQMVARVEAIAAYLIKEGIGRRKVVGVMQASTLDFVCSILAIWKVGATYTPLDPRLNSIDRLAAIIRECQPACVLIDASSRSLFDQLDSAAVLIDVEKVPLLSVKTSTQAKADDAAVVLYTSGTTGTPKGILLSHRSVRNNIEIATHHLWGFKEGSDIMLQQAAFSFDMSLAQTLTALANGGTLVVAPSQLRGDAAGLTRLLAAEGVTFTVATPTEYASWIGAGSQHLKSSKWRVAASGGEKMTQSLLLSFLSLGKPDLDLVNAYGPTETSFASNTRKMPYQDLGSSSSSSSSIADLSLMTWPNYSISIVDRDLQPVPAGVSGEVCIGGAGVGLGYFNNEELTSGAFVLDKSAPPEFAARGWTKKHRTGDRGRLSPDGGLILEGRIAGDTQIKLRGIRMDLADIESAILRAGIGRITQAALSVRQDGAGSGAGPQYLVAHVVLAPSDDASAHESDGQKDLLAEVSARLALPRHMKPSLIVPVSALPMSASHKLDRRALQALPISTRHRSVHGNNCQPGEGTGLTANQAVVWELWKEVIPSDVVSQYSVDPLSDFFHVGGTSLLLVNLQGLFEKNYGKGPPLHEMFESSTIADMTDLLFPEGTTGNAACTTIDWTTETCLDGSSSSPDPVTTDSGSVTVKSNLTPRVIVLTGVTGFLGRHLLNFLLRQPTITRIHCIAVRNPPSSSSSSDPFANPKISIHRGDLGAPRLGLSAADAASIFAEADAVIHNGADVSFLKTYATLRRTNVESTRVLARLAAPRRVPLHFISSASVAQLTGFDQFGEASVADWLPTADPRALVGRGYTAAKWASEVLLEKAARAWGLPVTVHRPSSITGDGAGKLDLMANLFRYVEDLEAVPDSGSWKGYFDFVSVENVAADIVEAVMTAAAQGEDNTGVRYLYEASEIVYPLSVVREMSESGHQLPVRTMPMKEWVHEATKKGLNTMLAEYLLMAEKTGSALAFPKLIKNASNK
ncbi:PKS-NRPS hybrid [Colletotrichum sublineola]|nr:PKS-NRPS hybrid [Colletotrichum sublineola]